MTRRGVLGALIGIASSLALSACGNGVTGKAFPPIRYKITAEVETPEGMKTGHSVLEFQGNMSGSIFGAMGGSGFNVRGEAIAVDLAPGQMLFVLLSAPRDADFAANALNSIKIAKNDSTAPTDRAGETAQTEHMFARLRANRGVYTLWIPKGQPRDETLAGVPYFVHFRNIADPKSVEQVDPDNLAKSFGHGVKLKALTIQITDETVTTGIQKRLIWLSDQRGSLVKYPSLTPIEDIPAVQRLNEGDFWRNF